MSKNLEAIINDLMPDAADAVKTLAANLIEEEQERHVMRRLLAAQDALFHAEHELEKARRAAADYMAENGIASMEFDGRLVSYRRLPPRADFDKKILPAKFWMEKKVPNTKLILEHLMEHNEPWGAVNDIRQSTVAIKGIGEPGLNKEETPE